MKPLVKSRICLRTLGASALATATLILASCAEQAGTGEQVALPTFVLNCTSAQCRTNVTAKLFVKIAKFSCDTVDDTNANIVTSTSMNVNCNGTSGCYATTVGKQWIDIRNGTVTSVPSSSYTICARIDYNNNYPLITNDDTTGSIFSQPITASTTTVTLGTWTDP